MSRAPKIRSMSALFVSSKTSQQSPSIAWRTRPGRNAISPLTIVSPPTRSRVVQLSSGVAHKGSAIGAAKPCCSGARRISPTTSRNRAVLPVPGGPTRITAEYDLMALTTIRRTRSSTMIRAAGSGSEGAGTATTPTVITVGGAASGTGRRSEGSVVGTQGVAPTRGTPRDLFSQKCAKLTMGMPKSTIAWSRSASVGGVGNSLSRSRNTSKAMRGNLVAPRIFPNSSAASGRRPARISGRFGLFWYTPLSKRRSASVAPPRLATSHTVLRPEFLRFLHLG